MARPRKDHEGPAARARIVGAFWGLLAEVPYERITVRSLASRAQVNHNTIYRHFESMEHLARSAVAEAYPPEAAGRMLAILSQPEGLDAPLLDDANLEGSVGKAVLAVRSGSPVLEEAVRDAFRACWMQVAGTSWEDLSHDAQLELTFVLGGIMSLLGTFRGTHDLLAVRGFLASRVGVAARETLAGLARDGVRAP